MRAIEIYTDMVRATACLVPPALSPCSSLPSLAPALGAGGGGGVVTRAGLAPDSSRHSTGEVTFVEVTAIGGLSPCWSFPSCTPFD